MAFRDQWISFIENLQDKICKGLEQADGSAVFKEDKWQRDGGGGGKTRIMEGGTVFEKGGVNSSVVFGAVTANMKNFLKIEGASWFACGLSLVIHPKNPFVPTVHANWRYFELMDEGGNIVDRWFGGGTDLTPYYLFEEDAVHFHQTLKDLMEPFGADLYPRYKKECDEYFVNHHRNNERRGVGGVFYDQLKPVGNNDLQRLFEFQQANGEGFLPGYVPIVARRKDHLFESKHKYWQELRRGRYVEFNLIHDKGTIFGLKTNGRTESILMSLPPTVRFDYDDLPENGSEEEELLKVLLPPREWATR